jgi:hypothetical protein
LRRVASGRDSMFPLLIPNPDLDWGNPQPSVPRRTDPPVPEHSRVSPQSAPHVSGSTVAEPPVDPGHTTRDSQSSARACDEPTLTKNQRRRLRRQRALGAARVSGDFA